MGDAVRITKIVLVCHDCRNGLVELGAKVSDEVTTFPLGHQCEAHPIAGVRVQAAHAVRVMPSLLRKWEETPVAELIPDDERGPFIAELAARVLSGKVDATDADVVAAVGTARRIVRAAKGG